MNLGLVLLKIGSEKWNGIRDERTKSGKSKLKLRQNIRISIN